MNEPIDRTTERAKGNERISPTALMIAHRRTFTDIPYVKDIYEELERIYKTQGKEALPAGLENPAIASQFEARYKLVNRLLRESGVIQVLEIAAGHSPRGLEMTDDPSFRYVEVDLSGIAEQKRGIVKVIGKDRVNLQVENGDALDLQTLQNAVSQLDPSKPIGIINEGLLRYLNFDQKAQVARNVHSLLERFGGVWITPDITLKSVMQAENAATGGQTDKVKELTGINIDQNAFSSVEEARKFFENLGFSIEPHRFTEVMDELVSPSKLGQTKEEVERFTEGAHAFVLRVQPS